jgi:stage III sporulation protein AD
MSPFAVCAFAVISCCAIAVLRHLRSELASIAVAVTGVLIFGYVVEGLLPFLKFIKGIAAQTGVESYFTLMLKSLAVSLCCRMSADICRDCGENSLASRVELAGKVGIVLISIPVVTQLFEIAKDMLG